MTDEDGHTACGAADRANRLRQRAVRGLGQNEESGLETQMRSPPSKGTKAAIAFIALITSGCALKPAITTREPPGPTLDEIVEHIQCEIRDVQTDNNPQDSQAVKKFNAGNYVAYVNLTLDATNNQSLTPGLTFLNRLGTLAGIVNFQISGTQHRNINPTFTLLLSPTPGNNQHLLYIDNRCKNIKEYPFGIKGNLGLKKAILSGVESTTGNDLLYTVATSATQASVPSFAAIPAFVSTIDFSITAGVDGGPNWTFHTFKGPDGGSNGLVNISRMEKDTLTISFAPTAPANVINQNEKRIEQLMLRRPGVAPQVMPMTTEAEKNVPAAAAAAQLAVQQSLLLRLNNIFLSVPPP
jgi:hypothetical protein